MKTRLYNFDPLKPHFYLVKLGFTGVYIIFLISAQKHSLWVLVRVSTIYVLSRNIKKYQSFSSENFQFLEMKFSIYLNRRVFVMTRSAFHENVSIPFQTNRVNDLIQTAMKRATLEIDFSGWCAKVVVL